MSARATGVLDWTRCMALQSMQANPETDRQSATNDQPLSSDAGQLLDDFSGILRPGSRNNRQIETVAGKTRKGFAIFDKLDQERCRAHGTPRPAVEITQQGRLVFTAEEDFRVALGKTRRERRKTYKGAWCIHRIVSLPQLSAGQVRGNTEPAL